ncbi:hypothetical protein [Enterobacter phage vB-EclM_KMB19]|jgi:hypothetical protein|nr:hypothetical protein [Enterobacter phage vB-EclM_KMB19]
MKTYQEFMAEATRPKDIKKDIVVKSYDHRAFGRTLDDFGRIGTEMTEVDGEYVVTFDGPAEDIDRWIEKNKKLIKQVR